MGCSSGPNFNKASLVYSLDATTPVGYDASANTIKDRCGRRRGRKRRKSTAHNSAPLNKNKGRGSFSLNGSSQYLSIPIDNDSDISAFTKFTVCAWIHPTTSTNFWIVSKGINGDDDDDTEFGVYLNSDGKAEVQIYDESEEKFTKSTCANALAANKWHFIAATFDGTNLQVSANIIDKGASQTSTVTIENTDTQLFIGRSHGTEATDFANGFIGMVKIYDDALPDADIFNIYRSKIKKFGGELATAAAGTGTGEEGTNVVSMKFLTHDVTSVTLEGTDYSGTQPTINYSIDWGDGSSNNNIQIFNDYGHSYSDSARERTITITGTYPKLTFVKGIFIKSFVSFGDWSPTDLASFYSSNDGPFASDINSWPVGAVTDFGSFFNNSDFNSNIGSWNTSSATNMQNMFNNAPNFNQNIGSWNVGNVTNMVNMFKSALSFNNGGSSDINNWNTANVTSFKDMFWGRVGNHSFNQPVGGWNVSSSTNFQSMFRNSSFNNGGNNNINNWTFKNSGNIGCRHMFRDTSFNQPIGGWTNTRRINQMRDMFRNNSAFDQDISAWDFRGIQNDDNMRDFLKNGELSTSNYDALLIRWASQANEMEDDIRIDMGDSKYTGGSSAASARSTLINTYDWEIDDGGSA